MKKVTVLLAAFVLPLLSMSQEKYEYSPKVKNRVEITNLLGEISLKNTSENTIVIESDANFEKPERAEGLQLLGAMEDNTGLAVNVSEEDGIVSITGISKQVRDFNYSISIPAGIAVSIDYHSPFASGDLDIDSYNGSLEIKTLSSDVKLNNCSGPFTVNSVSGDVEVIFSNVSQGEPTSLASVSGFVDVSIPAGNKANIEISNLTGNVYNNLNLESAGKEDRDERSEGLGAIKRKGKTSYKLNGGGQEIYLKSVSGNIYLRKK
ncbi:hypothetical protein GM418_13090 [Maribellus comscasis]|uniref:DUF4097 domain-containing protein n=1 Tax=Maribellus comscasis TaxID=2681766 RepID=A0A6I6JZG8_9BACT|nr:DUF4097 family beta strand repeat-containing protein [Maribellus comscasis]QGY44563.1 hypothetical protein GM418_13090 [Maribellus comscasis]